MGRGSTRNERVLPTKEVWLKPRLEVDPQHLHPKAQRLSLCMLSRYAAFFSIREH